MERLDSKIGKLTLEEKKYVYNKLLDEKEKHEGQNSEEVKNVDDDVDVEEKKDKKKLSKIS